MGMVTIKIVGNSEASPPEKGVPSGDNPIGKPKVGPTFSAAIENQQLVTKQRGFGNDGTESTGPRQSNYGNDHIEEEGEDVTHGMVSKLKSSPIQGSWGIRHGHDQMRNERNRFIALGVLLLISSIAVRAQKVEETTNKASAEGQLAVLIEGLGKYNRPITTHSAAAQRYFDQGLLFVYGYYFSEALACAWRIPNS